LHKKGKIGPLNKLQSMPIHLPGITYVGRCVKNHWAKNEVKVQYTLLNLCKCSVRQINRCKKNGAEIYFYLFTFFFKWRGRTKGFVRKRCKQKFQYATNSFFYKNSFLCEKLCKQSEVTSIAIRKQQKWIHFLNAICNLSIISKDVFAESSTE
jgi:hypothetical protein